MEVLEFFMTLPGIVIFLGAMIWICGYAILDSKNKTLQDKIDQKLKKLKINNTNERYNFKSELNEMKTIVVDNKRNLLYIISEKDGKDIKIPFKNIISSELKENGETIIKTSVSSQVGKAVIGGALLGGVGAIIGGTSGKKKENKDITSTYLIITTINSSNPFYQINFLGNDQFKKSRYWHSIMEGIIHKNKLELSQPKNEKVSFSDELLNLNTLLKEGALTQEEFLKCKQKILEKI